MHQVRRFPHYQTLLWSIGFPQSQPRSQPWQSQLQSWAQSRWILRHCPWCYSHGICPLESVGLSLKDWNKSTSTNKDKLEGYKVTSLKSIRDVESWWNTGWISKFQALGVNPAENSDKITDETRYGTFEYGVVTKNHGLVECMRIIDLTRHWNRNKISKMIHYPAFLKQPWVFLDWCGCWL